MAKVDLNRTTYIQINTVATRVQIFGGRIRVAASVTPVADDFQVWPEGEIIDITAVKFAQAVDTTPTWIVELPV